MTHKEKLVFSSLEAPPPRRKRKPKPDPLAGFEPYLALRAAALSGKMKPHEQKWFYVTPKDARDLGVKFPWRVAAERLRDSIKEAGLEGDMHVVKYETDTDGVWCVKITYEPPRDARG